MNPFQSDNIWKKKARQGKAQQHPLTPRQEWQKQVNSSSLWLGGGVVLLALYLAAVRAGTVALDASAVVLIVVVGCFCVYTAASLGRLMKNKPEEKDSKEEKESQKRVIVHLKWLRVRCAINSGIIIFVYCKAGMTAVIPALLFHGKGVVTGSGICFANRSAAQKPHWGFHCCATAVWLFCNH